jgi:transposase
MPRFIKTDKEYQRLMLNIDLGKQIVPGSFEDTIFKVIDLADTSIFEAKIKNDLTGRPAYNPKILLKVILYAYSIGTFYSRKISKLCIDNVIMMALSENTTPDFTLIADFISSNEKEITLLFQKVLLICEENKLLGHTTFALDGCKLPSNASKEWSGTFSELSKKSEKLKNKLQKIIDSHKSEDSDPINGEIEKHKKATDKLNKSISKIDRFLTTEQKKIGKRDNENKSNITDNESAKIQTGHGVIQGYNGQAFVDDKHQIIVGAEVFGTGPDNDLLEPMIEVTEKNMTSIGKSADYFDGKTIAADTGYFSEANLKAASDKKIDAYIPDQQFRKRDIRFKDKDKHNPKKNDKFIKEDFKFDSEKNCFVCKNNCILKKEGKVCKIKNNYYQKYIARQKDCAACKLRKKCLRNEKTRRRTLMFHIKEIDRDFTKEMIAKIDTIEGRKKYSLRMGIVEPVFANIRIHKGLDRFTLRGKSKVNCQWLLFCLVHNIGKIMKYGQLQVN